MADKRPSISVERTSKLHEHSPLHYNPECRIINQSLSSILWGLQDRVEQHLEFRVPEPTACVVPL